MEWREIVKKGSDAVSTAVKRGLNMQPRKWIVVNNSARLEEKRAHEEELLERRHYKACMGGPIEKMQFLDSMK